MSWLSDLVQVIVPSVLDMILKPAQEVVTEIRSDPAQAKQLALLVQMMREHKAHYEDLLRRLDSSKIISFNDLRERDAEMAAELVRLAQATPRLELAGKNIGFFGLTSVGKTSIVNRIAGRDVGARSPGESGTEINTYATQTERLWDFPGINDHHNYCSLRYIATIKGLTQRVLVINHTIKEVSSLVHLLRALQLSFIVAVTKCDYVDDDEMALFQRQVRAERDTLCPNVEVVFVAGRALRSMGPRVALDAEWARLLQILA